MPFVLKFREDVLIRFAKLEHFEIRRDSLYDGDIYSSVILSGGNGLNQDIYEKIYGSRFDLVLAVIEGDGSKEEIFLYNAGIVSLKYRRTHGVDYDYCIELNCDGCKLVNQE